MEHVGFQSTKPRLWVRSIKPSIRELFNVAALKAAGYSVRWGFSLDFVPLMWTKPPRWKRTDKSANFDLVVEPFDQGSKEFVFHHLPGAFEVDRATIRRIAEGSTKQAMSDFEKVTSLEDIARMFAWVEQLPVKRFGLENYVQAHLAWGLTLLHLGEREKGHALVAKACELHRFDSADRLLCKAIADADGAPART